MIRFLVAATFSPLLLAASPAVVAQRTVQVRNIAAPEMDASYRAVAVTTNGTAIVGGSNGTVIQTIDGGETWKKLSASQFDDLDFRDVEILSDGSVVLMSAGPGTKSQLMCSEDHGKTWRVTHRNELADGFFNGMAFFPNGHGLVVGDPIDGRLFLLQTSDSGITWDPLRGPAVEEGEYGFAASGTGIVANGDAFVAVATGAAASRAMISADHGQHWKFTSLPIRYGQQSEGAFSIAFRNAQHGVAVGGDYLMPDVADRNCAISSDGGQSWQEVAVRMPHKACVRFLDDTTVLAVGRTGIMLSGDRGDTWKTVSDESFYSFDYHEESRFGVLAGANGRVATFRLAESP